jgi:hypothetical protein
VEVLGIKMKIFKLGASCAGKCGSNLTEFKVLKVT